jgi:dihydropteroate synthase
MGFKDTFFSVKQTINCGGTLIDLRLPRVMGILNITPDSFYDGGKYLSEADALEHVGHMLSAGADMVDVGAYSSRPGSPAIAADEELSRLKPVLGAIRSRFPGILLSVDTYRASIADYVVRTYNVNMINDISAGRLDEAMFATVASLKVPYIMMHMQGTPDNMQVNPQYDDVVKDILAFFAERIDTAKNAGIDDLVIDPGFGFGKTLEHNYQLLREMQLLECLGVPILAGVSRKSMIYKALDINPQEALNGTTVLNTLALLNGASVLRVHDVKEARQAVRLLEIYQKAGR